LAAAAAASNVGASGATVGAGTFLRAEFANLTYADSIRYIGRTYDLLKQKSAKNCAQLLYAFLGNFPSHCSVSHCPLLASPSFMMMGAQNMMKIAIPALSGENCPTCDCRLPIAAAAAVVEVVGGGHARPVDRNNERKDDDESNGGATTQQRQPKRHQQQPIAQWLAADVSEGRRR
jgi:hypothetical protein